MRSKIAALALILMFVLPVALLATPANALTFPRGVNVVTTVASPNSAIVFVVNLTYLRDALGWVGSELNFYLSPNGFSQIDPAVDWLIPGLEAVYAADVEVIAGYIVLPDRATLQQLVSDYDPDTDTGFLYLKVFDGSNTAVSERIVVVLNTDRYLTLEGDKLAYAYGPLGTTNVFCFKANLTEIQNILATQGTTLDFNTTTSYYYANLTFISAVNSAYTITAFWANISNGTINASSSDIFALDANGTYIIYNENETVIRFNGTLMDFETNTSEYTMTTDLDGITVNYYPFLVSFSIAEARNGTTTFNLSNNTVRLIMYNTVIAEPVDGAEVTLPFLNVSLGYNGQVSIFPSVEYVSYAESTDPITIPDEINPNDNITVAIHNYPNGTQILAHIYRLVDGSYKLLTTVNLTDYNISIVNGTANVTITLPEAPYGGLPYTIAIEVDGVTGIPMVNTTAAAVLAVPVKPYIEYYFAIDNGTFRSPAGGPTAPGDFILVKGHGFLQETIDLYATTTDLVKVFDIHEKASYGVKDAINVFDNGTFIAVARIPGDVWYNDTFQIVAAGETPSDFGKPTATAYFDLGNNADGVQKVYVNPTPVVVNATYAYIQLGLSPAYPYPAVWEDIASRTFKLVIIGLDPVDFAKVSINVTRPNVNVNIFTNETPTNGFLCFKDVPVPVIPYGDYDIVVYNATDPTITETTNFTQIAVRPTAAAMDPNTGEYSKQISLMAIVNVNVTGYGWPAYFKMEWDIVELTVLGLENLSIVDADGNPVSTNGSGYFAGILQLELYITTPNIYHILIHITGNKSINDTITISIGEMPALTVKVDTAKTKFTGDVVDVWILITFGGELATTDQITGVKVSVYAYTDAGLEVIVDEALAEPVADGLWHYTFTIDPAYKGEDIAVLVKACGYYLPYLPKQVSYDLAAFTVAGVAADTLEQVNQNVQDMSTTFNEIKPELQNLGESLSQLKTTVEAVDAKVTDVQTQVTNIQTQLNNINAQLADIQTNIQGLSGKLDQLTQDIRTTVQEAVAQTANTDKIAGAVTTYGLANLAVTILGFAALIFLLRSKQG